MLGKVKQSTVLVQKKMSRGPILRKSGSHKSQARRAKKGKIVFFKMSYVKVATSADYLQFTAKNTMISFSTHLKVKTI